MIKLFLAPHYLLNELTSSVELKKNHQIKKWDELKTEFDLFENEKFLIVQITYTLPISWKEILRNDTESINNLVIQDDHLITKHQILSLNKLNSAT